MTTPRPLADKLADRNIPIDVQPLTPYSGKPLTLEGFEITEGGYGNDFAILHVITDDGVRRMLSAGGVALLRVLRNVNQEDDLPATVTFTLDVAGARKNWRVS